MKNLLEALKSPKKVDDELILSQATLARYDISAKRLMKSAQFHPGELNYHLNEIHVWTFPLDQPDDAVTYFTSLLAQDELSRAARLRSENAWKRFTTGRGWLRLILSQYVEQPPASLCFTYGLSGKPRLFILENSREAPYFNLAHSNGTGVLAVTGFCDVGIDLEYIHPIPEIETIASRYFSPREWASLAALPDKDKINGFFTTWTRKEAFVKARGEGFSLPFNTFTILLSAQGKSTIIELDGTVQQESENQAGYPKIDQDWIYLPVLPPQGYAAAMVIKKPRD